MHIVLELRTIQVKRSLLDRGSIIMARRPQPQQRRVMSSIAMISSSQQLPRLRGTNRILTECDNVPGPLFTGFSNYPL